MRLQYKIILFSLLLFWCAGIFLWWFIRFDERFLFILPHFQKTYSLVCHQQKAKLLVFDYGETLTCARCTGIYLGLLFSSAFMFFKEPKKNLPIKFLFIAATPMFADVILYSINVYRYSKPIAFSTGFLLGSIGFLYLYRGLINLVQELKN